MIVSSVPGRIRIRHPRLRDVAWAEAARQRVAALPGLEAVSNPQTGSLLATFDPARVSEERVVELLGLPAPAGAGADPAPSGSWRLPARPLETGLLATLGLTVAAGFLKWKWLHVAAGLALCGFVGAHVVRFGAPRASTEGESP